MTRVRAVIGTVVAALAASTAVLALPAPRAYAGEPCVGVIVDARLLGGAVSTGCADGDPDSGLEALTRAGFTYAFVPRQPGLVCQIDDAPECARTTTTTYWSYWYRAKGSRTWTYATRGAGSHDPEPGSTEAWVWQDGGRREPPDIALGTICPQASTARPPATATARATTKPSNAPTSAATTRAATGSGTSKPTASAPTSARASSAPASAPAASTSSAPAGSTPTSSAGPTRAAGAAARAVPDDGAPLTGLVAGVGLVGLLAAAAVTTARRRSRP